MTHFNANGRSQRGVALLTALLVVALATTAAVAMTSSQQLDIRRSANQIGHDQALLYLLGVEDWAGEVLLQDRRDSETDTLAEDWATVLPPIEVEGGQVAGGLSDLQGRFNVNNLVQADGKPDALQVERFRRLLIALSLEPDIAAAVQDWIDPDLEPAFPGGAEDGEYLGRQPGYRTPNAPIAIASELLAVAGIDAEVWGVLAPHVTALPPPTAINVNTATAPVIMSIADGITQGDADAVVETRGDEGFKAVNDFAAHPALAGRAINDQGLSVATEYFLLGADVQAGRIILRSESILHRGGQGIRVVARGFGGL